MATRSLFDARADRLVSGRATARGFVFQPRSKSSCMLSAQWASPLRRDGPDRALVGLWLRGSRDRRALPILPSRGHCSGIFIPCSATAVEIALCPDRQSSGESSPNACPLSPLSRPQSPEARSSEPSPLAFPPCLVEGEVPASSPASSSLLERVTPVTRRSICLCASFRSFSLFYVSSTFCFQFSARMRLSMGRSRALFMIRSTGRFSAPKRIKERQFQLGAGA